MRQVILLPFQFIRWVLSLGLRVLIIMAIVGVGGFFALRYFDILPSNDTLEGVETIPSTQEAPWIVQTDTRYYYAKTLSEEGGRTVMAGYWELEGDAWVFRGVELTLGSEYGQVRVHGR